MNVPISCSDCEILRAIRAYLEWTQGDGTDGDGEEEYERLRKAIQQALKVQK